VVKGIVVQVVWSVKKELVWTHVKSWNVLRTLFAIKALVFSWMVVKMYTATQEKPVIWGIVFVLERNNII
jgi:hypothetical protein